MAESKRILIKKFPRNFRKVTLHKDVLEMVKEMSCLWVLYCCKVLRESLTNMARQI